MTDSPHTDWVPERDNKGACCLTCAYWAGSSNKRLYLLGPDETVADQGCESLHPRLLHHHHPQPCGAECCTPGPLNCCGLPGLVRKAAVGRVVQLVACVLLSVQMAWGERTVAAVAVAAGVGGGCDGAEDRKCQLCAC